VTTRPAIPKKVREQVLKEYRHRCAICGGENPHLHHIDKNAKNIDPMNLIPLCPNCHLSDQHDPTKGIEPAILNLFRKFKDPAILQPPFYALFRRLSFLFHIEQDITAKDASDDSEELIDFVASLEMGDFYSKQLAQHIRKPRHPRAFMLGDPDSERQREQDLRKEDLEYLDQLRNHRDQAISLLVELLRFQNWQ